MKTKRMLFGSIIIVLDVIMRKKIILFYYNCFRCYYM